MSMISKSILVVTAFALAACSGNPFDRFGRRGGDATDGAANISTNGVQTSALDPASPAYFSETIGDRVFFLVDQATLSDAGRATLVSQAGWLTQNPTYTALIEGHADEQGTREYNLALGARRAAAARDFLVSQGVADSRLRVISYGKERPVEICSTEECYNKNRRAVTVISAGAGS